MANIDRLAKFRTQVGTAGAAAGMAEQVLGVEQALKIEQALEVEQTLEATHVREELVVTPVPAPSAEEVPPQLENRPKPGWHSPTYHMCRTVKLVPEIVSANRCITFDGHPEIVDAYKILRTQILQKMQQMEGNTLMVTSALPGDGKTTTAINLAFTMAREFQQTVLLVDCDLQQQDVHKQLGYPSDKGLIDYLLDDCPVTELFTWPGVEKITVVSGGRTIRESSELLGSPRMKELVADMKSRYPGRCVIFDMQSISAGADALVFAPLVDHIIMVVQEGKTPLDDIKRTVSMLPEGKLLGLMLNRRRIARRPVANRKSYDPNAFR